MTANSDTTGGICLFGCSPDAITGKAESFKRLLHSKESPKLNFSERALKTVDATALQNAGALSIGD